MWSSKQSFWPPEAPQGGPLSPGGRQERGPPHRCQVSNKQSATGFLCELIIVDKGADCCAISVLFLSALLFWIFAIQVKMLVTKVFNRYLNTYQQPKTSGFYSGRGGFNNPWRRRSFRRPRCLPSGALKGGGPLGVPRRGGRPCAHIRAGRGH